MGLTLKLTNFAEVVIQPEAVLLGLFGQLLALPIAGFLIALAFGLNAHLAIGLMIIAACPGGATSNFMTYLAKGDVALSVVLTALSGLVAIFTMPIIINFGLEWFSQTQNPLKLPLLQTIWNIFTLTALPVMVGMVIRRLNVGFAEKMEKIFTPLSFIFLIFIMGLIGREVWPVLGGMLSAAWLPTIILNFSMVTFGYLIAAMAGLSHAKRRTLGIEVGYQNYTLGIVIAIVLLKDPMLTIVPIVYLFVMYVSGIFVVLQSRRANRKFESA